MHTTATAVAEMKVAKGRERNRPGLRKRVLQEARFLRGQARAVAIRPCDSWTQGRGILRQESKVEVFGIFL